MYSKLYSIALILLFSGCVARITGTRRMPLQNRCYKVGGGVQCDEVVFMLEKLDKNDRWGVTYIYIDTVDIWDIKKPIRVKVVQR